MSVSRERLMKDLSSSIFSPKNAEDELRFRPKKRLVRDGSADGFMHGIKRVDTPTGSSLKPLDHSPNELFGDFPRDFYKKNEQGLYHSFSKEHLKTNGKEEGRLLPRSMLKKVQATPEKPAKDLDEGKRLEDFKADNKETPRAKTPNFVTVPKPEEAKVDILRIKGLGPKENELSIKQMCQGVHIIEIVPEIDNVTGDCIGSANIKVRSYPQTSDLDRLRLNFLEKGLEVSYITMAKGKKNNYPGGKRNFLDSMLQQEEKRLTGNNLSSSERKRAVLATSDDLFGNSPGTGQWKTPPEENPLLKDSKKTFENLKKWDSLKTIHAKTPITPTKKRTYGYSRPTVSSRNKEAVNKY